IAYGYNLGVLVDFTERLSWGLTYHSKVKYSLEGDTKVSDMPAGVSVPNTGGTVPFSALNGKYDASVDITMPESVDTSVTYRLDDQWTLYGGATWTRWSRLESLVVENQTSNPVVAGVLGRKVEPLKWSNTWSFA